MNTATKEALSREIKSLQALCNDVCNIIANQPLETAVPKEDSNYLTLNYIEGVRTDIENSTVLIPTDLNLITSQFLNDITEKNNEVKELTVFTRGLILDMDNEINRLNKLTQISEEAIAKAKLQKKDGGIQPVHVERASKRYRMMKDQLFKLMNSLFPTKANDMLEIIVDLMRKKTDESSDDYIEVTNENYVIVELLKDMNIASTNPYNNSEIKLNFSL